MFASETGSDDEEFARVGYITDITTNGRDIHINYVFDSTVSPISNTKLEDIADKLGIHSFEFSRTH